MAKKGSDRIKGVEEAIAFIRSVRAQAPPNNQIISAFLNDKETDLLNQHFDLSRQGKPLQEKKAIQQEVSKKETKRLAT